MAVGEIFLSAFIQVVFQKLLSPELIKFAHREGVHTAVKKWRGTLVKIQAVLRDAEQKQITDEAVKLWLDELQDLAYDVDDILDEFATEFLHRKMLAEPESSTSKVRSLIPTCCTSFSPSAFVFNMRIGSKIKEITSRLEDISKQRTELGLEKISGETSTKVWQRPPTTSLVDEPHVYGRDKDKKEIIELLLRNAPTDNKVGVISIVGMGGLGKTTLAQLGYNDDTVKQHFDLKAWVCVSDEFDVMKITNAILESCTTQTSDSKDLNQVQIKLKEALTGKRFLIVLDDVWNKKYGDWDVLRSPFGAGEQGSKILVTTRDRNVALMMGTVEYSYNLEQLSNSDCWSVFVRHAFENRNIDANPKLKEIGEKIVEKCRGLPLAVKTLAGLLRHKLEDDEWEDILNSKIWDLPAEGSDILPALRLSYHHLPSHLKRCFAYSSILPKDYEFEENEIILLWMAEGFLQQPKGNKQLEDLGSEYFRDLLSRSFFQLSSSNKSLYVMHDLINDLAQWVAGEICFKLEDKLEGRDQCKISQKARHLSYIGGNYDGFKKFEAFYEVKCTLRTFLPLMLPKYGGLYLTNNVPQDLLPKLRCLRVLSLRRYHITELPDSIGDLKHLRYLDLSNTSIRSLPESTSTLYNLQTLKLTGCSRFKRLPTGMRNLTNLRHLDITRVNSIKEMPQMGMLTSLQTLSNFVVGRDRESGIRELRKLLHLRGVLSISRLENVVDAREAREANLNDKLGLEVLEMEWSSDLDDNSRAVGVEINVLDMLQPHKKLKELTIKCYSGTIFPKWIGHPSFSDMVLLRLENCAKCTSLPPLGQLSSLKDLCIRGMNKVTSVDLEFYGDGCPRPFPSLETLSFDDMQEWKDWFHCGVDRQVEVFHCLRELSIERCPKLLGKLPDHLLSLEKLVVRGCPQLAISISSLPKLCELDIKECHEEVVQRNTVDLSSLKTMVLSNIPKLMCLTEGFLQGLTNIEDLTIAGCRELTSLWQNETGLLEHLTSLRRLTIEDCPKLASFPETGLPSMFNFAPLEYLRIERCDSVTSIARGQLPSTLKKLEIFVCKNLQFLLDEEEGPSSSSSSSSPTMDKSNNSDASLLEGLFIRECPSLKSLSSRAELPATLKSLYVDGCPKLEAVAERMHNNTSLERINISNCESLKSLPEGLHNLSRLSNFLIRNCPRLVSFPDGGLPATNLKCLLIWNCEKLEALPDRMHDLTSLQQLDIDNCPGIVSFPEEGFPTNLTSLWISDLVPISGSGVLSRGEWGLNRLTSLRELSIAGPYPDLVSYPEEEKGMILLNSLRNLRIGNFSNLEYLSSKGFQNLTSLESLSIYGCPKLQSFPEEGLPPSLLQLYIDECPLLQQRCKKDKGRDWHKISHIPCVEIDGRFIYDPEHMEE